MKMLLTALLAASLCLGARVSLVSSPLTPFNITNVLALAQARSQFQELWTLPVVQTNADVLSLEADIIFDYTYNEHFTLPLQSRAESGLYFLMWPGVSSLCLGCSQYGAVFSQYLRALNFSRVLVVTDTEDWNLALSHSLANDSPDLYRDVAVLPKDADNEFVRYFVGRQVKPRGINLIAVLLSPLLTSRLLAALDSLKLNRPGFAFVLSQQAGFYRYLSQAWSPLMATGALIVMESVGSAGSREEFEGRMLAEQLDSLKETVEFGLETGLKRKDLNGFAPKASKFALFYMNNSQAVAAALSPSDVTWRTRIQFPGNTTVIPTLHKATIRASVNYEVVNPDLSIYPLGPQLMRGFQVAFSEANARTDLIPDYFLEDYSVSFTGMAFSYNLSKQRVVAGRKDLGLVFMMPPVTQGIIGMTKIFAELNQTIPIAAGSLGSTLSDSKAFPLYIRPRVANKYLFTIVGRMVRYFGWENVAVLYAADKGDFEDGYQQFLSVLSVFGITVTNSVELRSLPVVLNSQTAGAVNASLVEIMSSKTRIVLILHSYNFVIMEQMYDLGIREQYVQLHVTGLNDAVFQDPAYLKRRIVSKGALLFFPRLFIGPIGDTVRKELLKRDGSGLFPNTCFFYDVAYLYFHATDYLLENGYDYEDSDLIVKAMRDTYFYGCSGFIKIDSETNDRVASEIAITNFQYSSENDTYVLKVVGAYNPYSTQPYQMTSTIQWPDDGATYSDLKPLYKDCPFLDELVRSMSQGRTIGLVVDFTVAFATMIVTVVIWKKWWDVHPAMLKSKHHISIEDVLVLATVVCDYFQFAAVGPDLSRLSSLLASLSASFGFNMDAFLNITNGVYWIVLDIVLALVVVWTTICLLKFTGTDMKLGKVCGSFEYWTDLLMPTLGNLLFLPIISTLTNVFLCYKGVSDDMHDSFLNKDCYAFCWQGSHLGYAIGSGLGLLCYIPLAIFTRPLWQELQTNVHVKAAPLALMVKSAVQVFLIVSSNTLKQDSPDIHAVIFFITVAIYMWFMTKSRHFNYDRLNLWQILVMGAMLSLAVVGFVANRYSQHLAVSFVLVLVIEYVLIGGLGVAAECFFKKFESKLIRDKGRDVRGLFTFAFTGGKRAAEALEQFYTVNSVSVNRGGKTQLAQTSVVT